MNGTIICGLLIVSAVVLCLAGKEEASFMAVAAAILVGLSV